MTIDEAIKILTHYETDLDAWNDEPTEEAVQLGIEALKRERDNRLIAPRFFVGKLPGETEE